ncbi:hypothetical protein K449DRAFT_421280 [Hypoxylon sp. EC38]|nr:hypothetical protein K449DRAFT_421280 [Hypoxylon sp. EC38]
MRDENKDDYHEPRKPVMPYISVPTETISAHDVLPNQQPPSVTTTSFPGTSSFLLGIDTCGFTTSSTRSNRGCCLPGDYDCVSTIYTECIDYGEAPNAGACGAHTLCCEINEAIKLTILAPHSSDSNPYCFTYAYSTDKDPGATFTYVECNPSDGYGEMFPFPPELAAMTTSTTDAGPPSTSQPQASSSHSSSSMGGIIGGVIGGVVFIVFIIVAVALLFRYRQRGRHAATIRASHISAPTLQTPHSSTDISPAAEKEQAQAVAAAAAANKRANRRSFLRPLSLIREHPASPDSSSPSSPPRARYKHKSAADAAPARQSFGPNWPLGPDPGSNPLGAHPIDANLKKRLSDSRLGARGLATATATAIAIGSGVPTNTGGGGAVAGNGKPLRVPVLRLPPPGTKRPPPKSPRSSGGTPTSAWAALQSPRLDWVPVSPILGVAFGDEDGNGNGNRNRKSVTWGDEDVGPRRDDVATGTGTGVDTLDTEREPVSPIGSDEEVEEDLQRSSYVSAPSAYSALDGLVSPVSPRGVGGGGDDGDVTVSPLESRRGSLGS